MAAPDATAPAVAYQKTDASLVIIGPHGVPFSVLGDDNMDIMEANLTTTVRRWEQDGRNLVKCADKAVEQAFKMWALMIVGVPKEHLGAAWAQVPQLVRFMLSARITLNVIAEERQSVLAAFNAGAGAADAAASSDAEIVVVPTATSPPPPPSSYRLGDHVEGIVVYTISYGRKDGTRGGGFGFVDVRKVNGATVASCTPIFVHLKDTEGELSRLEQLTKVSGQVGDGGKGKAKLVKVVVCA